MIKWKTSKEQTDETEVTIKIIKKVVILTEQVPMQLIQPPIEPIQPIQVIQILQVEPEPANIVEMRKVANQLNSFNSTPILETKKERNKLHAYWTEIEYRYKNCLYNPRNTSLECKLMQCILARIGTYLRSLRKEVQVEVEMDKIKYDFNDILERVLYSRDIDEIHTCIDMTSAFDHIFQTHLLRKEKCIEETVVFCDQIKQKIRHHLLLVRRDTKESQ